MYPNLPIPTPLRGSDKGTFTEHTLKVRMPAIAGRVLQENDLSTEAGRLIQMLVDEIPEGRIRPLTPSNAPDFDLWNEAIAPYKGQTWLQIPWFFAETYLYRRIIEAVDYFNTGLDPFATQKQVGLTTTMTQSRTLSRQRNQHCKNGWQTDRFIHLLLADLWGNQADLSVWAAGDSGMPNHADADSRTDHLLVDDGTAVTHHIATAPQNAHVDFIIDNAGFELVGDLCLADYLLGAAKIETINFHLKLHPTFVSDATILDVQETIDLFLEDEDATLRELGSRIKRWMGNGRLQLHIHPFWTSPYPMWQMPSDLRQQLATAHLVISKGDANYRRALGDAHWPFTTPFASIVSYFPTAVLFLRTCKSEIVTGLKENQVTQLTKKDPNWLVNGRWGLIQFVKNSTINY